MSNRLSISKDDIIAELEDLGFEEWQCGDNAFVYKELNNIIGGPIIGFYRIVSIADWKYGVDFGIGKFKVICDGRWKDVDPMPIADLMVLYK